MSSKCFEKKKTFQTNDSFESSEFHLCFFYMIRIRFLGQRYQFREHFGRHGNSNFSAVRVQPSVFTHKIRGQVNIDVEGSRPFGEVARVESSHLAEILHFRICDFAVQEPVILKHHNGSTDNDDLLHDPCSVLVLATVRPDAQTTTMCRIYRKMVEWFTDTTHSSVRAFVCFATVGRGLNLLPPAFHPSNLPTSARQLPSHWRVLRFPGVQGTGMSLALLAGGIPHLPTLHHSPITPDTDHLDSKSLQRLSRPWIAPRTANSEPSRKKRNFAQTTC